MDEREGEEREERGEEGKSRFINNISFSPFSLSGSQSYLSVDNHMRRKISVPLVRFQAHFLLFFQFSSLSRSEAEVHLSS